MTEYKLVVVGGERTVLASWLATIITLKFHGSRISFSSLFLT